MQLASILLAKRIRFSKKSHQLNVLASSDVSLCVAFENNNTIIQYMNLLYESSIEFIIIWAFTQKSVSLGNARVNLGAERTILMQRFLEIWVTREFRAAVAFACAAFHSIFCLKRLCIGTMLVITHAIHVLEFGNIITFFRLKNGLNFSFPCTWKETLFDELRPHKYSCMRIS